MTELGPYEHIFADGSPACYFCGWALPPSLPAGTPYGRGKRATTGPAELDKKGPVYTWLGEQGGGWPMVVEKSAHAGWVDWNESNAPLCARKAKS